MSESGPSYFLASDVRACELEHGAVFLNLRTLKYFATDARFSSVLRVSVVDWPQTGAACGAGNTMATESRSDFLHALAARGLLATSPPTEIIDPTDLDPPTQARHPDWSLRTPRLPRARSAIALTSCVVAVSRAFRREELRSLLVELQRSRRAVSDRATRGTQDLGGLLTDFCRLRVWFYTARDRCLFDSLVLASYLLGKDIAAQLILGVCLRPFSAHAWVQVGPIVLDDSVEHVREYSPILVV